MLPKSALDAGAEVWSTPEDNIPRHLSVTVQRLHSTCGIVGGYGGSHNVGLGEGRGGG